MWVPGYQEVGLTFLTTDCQARDEARQPSNVNDRGNLTYWDLSPWSVFM